jgi:hypothetical protein
MYTGGEVDPRQDGLQEMNDVLQRYPIAALPGKGCRPVLRGQTMVWCEDRSLVVLDSSGTRSIPVDWDVDSYELTPDGQLVLALGDDSKRARVWETATGNRVFDFTGDVNHRRSLRGGLTQFGEKLYALLVIRNQPISIMELPGAGEVGWISTTGIIWFHPTRMFGLAEHWLAVHGYYDGESRDVIVVFSLLEAMQDPMVLYSALTEDSSIREWGDTLAAGPAGPKNAVFFRDADWDEDEPPDDPAVVFHGLVVWDLNSRAVIQRIEYHGEVADGATMGADANCVAIEFAEHVEIVSRSSGEVAIVDALALDPFQMQVARLDVDAICIVSLGQYASFP